MVTKKITSNIFLYKAIQDNILLSCREKWYRLSDFDIRRSLYPDIMNMRTYYKRIYIHIALTYHFNLKKW